MSIIRIFIILIICFGGLFQMSAQDSTPDKNKKPSMPEYEMRTYYMGFLKRGPQWGAEATDESAAIGEGHMQHIIQMVEDKKLILAGPFIHGPDAPKEGIMAGIFLFDVQTLEEARALCDADPAVQAGRFTIELLQWYGPVGIRYDGMK